MPVTYEGRIRSSELKFDVEKLSRLDFILDKWVKEGVKEKFCVKINRYGVPIYEGAYGSFDIDGPALRIDSIFPVFSNSKPIIAALLLILQEQGGIDLCDPPSEYLGEFMGEGRDKIQIWQFLTHTSGIFDSDRSEFVREYLRTEFDIIMPERNEYEEWKRYMLIAHEKMELPQKENDEENADYAWEMLVKKMPLMREPHTVMSYCNYGYQLAKEIICKITGSKIDEAARKFLFDPLGMNDSFYKLPKELWNRVIKRSVDAEGYPYACSEDCYENESGSNGLKTTVADILKFAEMIRNNGIYDGKQIMSRFSVNLMKTNQNTNMHPWQAWTMGFNYKGTKQDDSGMLRSEGSIDHGGFAGSKFVIDTAEGLTYAVYSVDYKNQGYCIYGRLGNLIYSSLL